MNQLQVFNYQGNEIQALAINGEPWWVLKEVCDVLEHSNSRKIAERLDEDEKGVTPIYTPGGIQQMTIINESGLYNVILRSDKPEAKKFKRWLTHEVLPQIRRQGFYMGDLPPEKLLEMMAMMAELLSTLKAHGQGAVVNDGNQSATSLGIAEKFSLPEIKDSSGKSLTDADNEEADFWESLLCEWRLFRSSIQNKSVADMAFISTCNEKYPEMNLSFSTLHRKWKKYKDKGKHSLVNYQGRHGNHRRKKVVVTVDIEE